MFDRRTKKAEIFKDTEHLYKNNDVLKGAVQYSIKNQKLILANETVEFEVSGDCAGKLVVSEKEA